MQRLAGYWARGSDLRIESENVPVRVLHYAGCSGRDEDVLECSSWHRLAVLQMSDMVYTRSSSCGSGRRLLSTTGFPLVSSFSDPSVSSSVHHVLDRPISTMPFLDDSPVEYRWVSLSSHPYDISSIRLGPSDLGIRHRRAPRPIGQPRYGSSIRRPDRSIIAGRSLLRQRSTLR